MKKQDKNLVISVIATLATAIALIYTLIKYHNNLFVVIGVSVVFLVAAFLLTQNLISFSAMKNKSIHVHLKECANDIATQIETANDIQAQIGKATYLYTKQTAQAVAALQSDFMESQESLYKSLDSLSVILNKAVKVMVKFDQANTTKVIASINSARKQLNETLSQGFDQLRPDHSDLIKSLENIENYLKNHPDEMDPAISLQLNNLAHELQNISNSIQQLQMPLQQTIPMTSMVTPAVMNPVAEPAVGETSYAAISEPAADVSEAVVSETATSEELAITEINTEIPVMEETAPEPTTEELVEAEPVEASSAIEETTVEEQISETAVEEIISEETLSAPVVTPLADKDPNEKLSADDIAALFASLG